jgi:cytochrome b pre-mRNA-processing protein 3
MVAVPAVALLLAVVVFWPGGLAAERKALIRMPAEERRELYDETRRNAESLCAGAHRERALIGRCERTAEFLQAFPECDEACVAFARAQRREPTR